MSNQLQITGGAKVRNLNGVITGSTGVLSSLPINGSNGIPQLDSNGKILVSQLPNSVMEYLGTWDVSTNTPYLVNGVGNAGDVYLVTGAAVGGTTHDFGSGPILFYNGDQAIYDGTTWQRASGSTGTVTSVAVTESSAALTITGSPITNSGTINIGFAGTSAQYVAGDGSLVTFPGLAGFVPYTGALYDVNLGEYGISAGFFGFDLTPTSTPTSVGTMSWDSFYKTPQVITGVGNTTLQIGQEEVILIHNNTGSTLVDGQVVYITGSTGELPSVSLASSTSETTSAATLGVITETIANGADGFVTVSGIVHGLNTLAYNEGDLLWLGTTAGTFTTTKPVSPNHLVLIGYVVKKAGGNGSILVKIQNTQELSESSDVLFTSLANNDILAYESSTSLWKNKTIDSVLGYTPVTNARTISTTAPLQGGGDLSANRTLSITQSGTSSDGYLSSTDWNTFNNKQNALGFLPIGGSGSINYIAKFTGSTTISQSGIYEGATGYVSIGNTNTTYNLDVTGTGRFSSYLTAENIRVDGNATYGGGLSLKQYTGFALGVSSGYTSMYADTSNHIMFTINNSPTDSKIITFNYPYGNAVSYNYTLPNGSGTLALTSQIPSLSGYIQGSGTTNYVPKFTASGTIGNSTMQEMGTGWFKISGGSNGELDLVGTGQATLSLYDGVATNYVQGLYTDFAIYNQNGATVTMLMNYNYSSKALTFQTNGNNERMRISSSGNVGIGTSSPAYLLDVTGTGRFTGALTMQGNINVENNFVLNLGSNQGGGATLKYNSNGNLDITPRSGYSTIFTSGNVGIGTSSPSYPLHLKNATYSQMCIEGGNAADLILYNSGGTTNLRTMVMRQTSSNYLSFFSANDAGTINTNNILTLNNTGYVGVGTSSPIDLLHLAGGMTSTGLSVPSNTSIGSIQIGYDGTNGVIRTWNSSPILMSTYGYYAVQTSGSERMRITSGGNVGIGTSSPNVSGQSSSVTVATIKGSSSWGGYEVANNANTLDGLLLGFYGFTNPSLSAGYTMPAYIGSWLSGGGSGSGADIRFHTQTIGTAGAIERMRITSGGNVGIGTSSPITSLNSTLTVIGTGIFQTTSVGSYNENLRLNRNSNSGYSSLIIGGAFGSASGTGVGQWTLFTEPSFLGYGFFFDYNGTKVGTIDKTTGIYTALSDVNKKKDFEVSTIGLNEILSLKPILYRMKTDDDNADKQLGFIAQEVKEFIPQAYVEGKDFIGLNDRPIIAALVKAIQEQQKQIEELKAKINE